MRSENSQSCEYGKYGGKRPLGRPMHRRVDNIKTHVKETGWERIFIRLGHGHVART